MLTSQRTGVRLQYPATKIATMVSEVLGAICVPLALTGTPAALAQAVESATLTADIPAQPLAQALAEFSRQTDLNVVYVSEVVREKKSRAVSAGLRAEAALTYRVSRTSVFRLSFAVEGLAEREIEDLEVDRTDRAGSPL